MRRAAGKVAAGDAIGPRTSGSRVSREPQGRVARRLVRRSVPSVEPGRTRPPAPVPRSAWMLPDPADADADGVVGIGADLSPGTLVDAYRRGIFPWPHTGIPLPWFSPDPRGILRFSSVHVSRSLRRTLRQAGWTSTVDAAFTSVVAACAQRDGGTWITPSMMRAYRRLHELGWAHSIEIWDGAALVGGLYGVQLGGVFTGESMFHRRADASKAALLDLASRFAAAGGHCIDVQVLTDHLARLGATEEPRDRFLEDLARVRERDVRMPTRREPVARLAVPT